jgi:hypothetical protein
MHEIMKRLLAQMDAHQGTMDVNQERLEAEMKTVQENTDTNLKEMTSMKTQIGYLPSRTNVNQEKAEAYLGEMNAWEKRRRPAKKRRRPI